MLGFVNDGEYKLPNDAYVDEWKGDTWYPVLKKLNEAITALEPDYEVIQIKEKFGGLRYYITIPMNTHESINDLINELVNKAEEECENIDSRNGINRYY